MKSAFTICIATLLCYNFCSGTIRRVGYPGIGIAGIDFGSLQQAHDAAVAGDTLQFYFEDDFASLAVTFSKKLYVIGYGHNLDNNTGLQTINVHNTGDIRVTFNEGSQYSIFEGLAIRNVYMNTSHITLKRCSITFSVTFTNSAALDSIAFIGCLISRGNGTDYQIGGGTPNHTNILFANCYIAATINFSPNSTGRILNCITQSQSTTPSIEISNSRFLIKNCILRLGSLNGGATSNTIYENNFFTNAAPAPGITGANNRFSQDPVTIFSGINGDYSSPCGAILNACFTEKYYLLKESSLAANGGFDDLGQPTDCGMFGGEDIYKYQISGIPSVPSIYLLTSPSGSAATTNPFNVNISVRSNN